MNILSIDTIHRNDDGGICVVAVIEDAVQTHSQTLYDPAEHGPALCEAFFTPDDEETIPDNDCELINYLEELDLNWELVDNEDYYFD
jgi:hypothetical protein